MEPTYEDIIGSKIFKFIVGSRKKEYHVHAAAISPLSKPLNVLLDGPHKEAQELCVEWPDVDEKTFVRFTQWAYTKNYVTEEPDIVLGQHDIPCFDDKSGENSTPAPTDSKDKSITTSEDESAEKPLYSLLSAMEAARANIERCSNANCDYYRRNDHYKTESVVCLVCLSGYQSKRCKGCSSAFSECPKGASCITAKKNGCSKRACTHFGHKSPVSRSPTCPMCLKKYNCTACSYCASAFAGCPSCSSQRKLSLKVNLIAKFLNKDGTECPSSTSAFIPRKNTEGCEDYTGVFMCHAKLYVLGDTYDIPQLRQLSLHRLYVTLREFTLYPSRFNDLATLAQYIFDNTRPDDRIREIIALYYACIVEDALKHDGLQSLLDTTPEFAFGLISNMRERLS